jgi:two-component system cell cycle response regulator
MKVLIVDNVKLFQVIISNLFASHDLEPVMQETGHSALSALDQEQIDVICISMYLPDTDGIALCQKIRTLPAYQYTPIILFTAETNSELLKKAMAAGITEIFDKQDIQQLVTYIKRFTAQHQSIDAQILYIEDSISQRAATIALFTSFGLTVTHFSNAEEAWDNFLIHDYDLVVTDIVLEGVMSGISLVNHIRRLEGQKGDTPILAVTGFDDISRRIELFNLGVNDYIAKPIIQQEIMARIKNLITSYHSTQEQINLITTVLENSLEAVFVAEYNKTIRSVNKVFVNITGQTSQEVEGKSLLGIMAGESHEMNTIWDTVNQQGSWQGKVLVQHKSGQTCLTWLNLFYIKSFQGTISHYIGRMHLYRA